MRPGLVFETSCVGITALIFNLSAALPGYGKHAASNLVIAVGRNVKSRGQVPSSQDKFAGRHSRTRLEAPKGRRIGSQCCRLQFGGRGKDVKFADRGVP